MCDISIFNLFSMFYSLKYYIILDDMERRQLVIDWIDSKFSFDEDLELGKM